MKTGVAKQKNFSATLVLVIIFSLIAVCSKTVSAQNTAASQIFHNLDFSQLCDTSQTRLCYWDLSWGDKGTCLPDNYQNKTCLLITGKKSSSVGFAEQSANLTKTDAIQLLEVSVKISSENIIGRGAGINIGIYDADGGLLANKDMGYASLNWVLGSTGWETYSVKMICPAGAKKIKLGAILYGSGKARFTSYKFNLTPVTNRKPSAIAIKYISAVCDTIAKNSLVRDSLNITQIKKEALQIAGPAKTYKDCYPAVEYLLSALRLAGDEHSFLITSEEHSKVGDYTTESSNTKYANYKLIDGYGYISVPAFRGENKKLIQAFSDTIQQAISQLNAQGIKGWIIDLREDMGGNMEPMLTGLGPLFSADTLGYLVKINNNREPWSHKDKDYAGDVLHPVTLSKQLPVAVLTGHNSGSSGEIVVISFIGNAKTKSFGSPTWGLTTGNGNFKLMDGAVLMLASTVMADRNGKKYHGSVIPDVLIEKSADTKNDAVLMKAIEWLKTQE